MILKKFVLGSLEDNNYLLINDGMNASREAILIDCTEESEDIDRTLQEYGATLKYILLTHGHFDHVLGVNNFKKKYDCKVLVHENDKVLLDSMPVFARNFGIPSVEIQEIDGYIKENDIIKFGEDEIKVIHTPGHTQGGVCYLIGNDIFTGDTLFFESVGRTDLPGGNFSQLKSNIQEKLFTLNEKIRVHPGHGPSSTMGHERVNNQFL